MFDDNCSLHTAAAIYNLLNPHHARITIRDVSRITGFMEGPGHNETAIGDMFHTLGISDGTYTWFDSLQGAIALMSMRKIGTPFGFGYTPTIPGMGHIVVAIRSLGGIIFHDYQIHERQGPYVPIEISISSIPQVGYRYIVFRPGVV